MRVLLAPPSDLIPRGPGRRLWREVVAVYDMRPDERVLLEEAARMVDELAELRGRDNAHTKRMVVRTELRRTLGQLGLSDAADEAARSDHPEDALARARAEREAQASRRGRRAAQARWSRQRDASP